MAVTFRIHRREHGPWWFSSSMLGRFDLSAPNGTCYLAEAALGAYVEAFQDWSGGLLPLAEVQARVLSRLAPPVAERLADCVASLSAAFGIIAEIHASSDRDSTQSWAGA